MVQCNALCLFIIVFYRFLLKKRPINTIPKRLFSILKLDAAFSAEALAAPVIAAMALGATQAHPAAQNPLLTSPVAKA